MQCTPVFKKVRSEGLCSTLHFKKCICKMFMLCSLKKFKILKKSSVVHFRECLRLIFKSLAVHLDPKSKNAKNRQNKKSNAVHFWYVSRFTTYHCEVKKMPCKRQKNNEVHFSILLRFTYVRHEARFTRSY